LTTAVTRFGIGTPAQGGAGGWNGDIAEVIYYSAALSNADRARVEAYLAAKWGISGVHAPATATSDPVGYWGDKSGNGRHVTQATAANRPTISATKQNGRNALAFNGSSQSLSIASYNAENGLPGLTRYVVASMSSAAPSLINRVWSGGGDAIFSTVSGEVRFFAGASAYSAVASANYALLTSGTNIIGSVYDGTAGSVAGGIKPYYNGAAPPLSSTSGTLPTTLPSGTPGFWIGSNIGVNSFWPGRIVEYISYSRALGNAERQRLERYLAAKWGITLSPAVSNAEAQDWINRVYANGGTVSASTASAVNTLCDSLDASGVRPLIYRMGIFAGSGLNACLVPLYRNWSGWSGRNLLSTGDNLTASAWTKSASTVSVSASERPFATGPFAYAATASAGSGVTPYVVNTSNNYGYGTVTVSAYLKANGINSARILLSGSSGMTFPGGGSVAFATVNLTNGALSSVLAGATATATDAGNGWWRLALTVANNATGNMAVRIDIGSGSSYTATGSESILVWGIQSEVASAASAYEPYPLGNTTDTNVGPFVSEDYAETTGLAAGSGKYLRTGLTQANVGVASHLAFYDCVKATNAYANRIGSRGAGDTHEHAITNLDVATSMDYASSATAGTGRARTTGYTQAGAFWLGVNPSATSAILYRNGVSAATSTPSARTAQNLDYWAFALNNNGTLDSNQTTGRSGGYSIGTAMDATQVAAYHTAMQAFQTALSRNV
jgi:hypothetical protein